MTVHFGVVTADLARIGSKLEPLLEKLRYDDTFVDPATFVANFFQAHTLSQHVLTQVALHRQPRHATTNNTFDDTHHHQTGTT